MKLKGSEAEVYDKPDQMVELKAIEKLGLYKETKNRVVFVDDGLARGASVMARCRNSMGVPSNPVGGIRGG